MKTTCECYKYVEILYSKYVDGKWGSSMRVENHKLLIEIKNNIAYYYEISWYTDRPTLHAIHKFSLVM